MLRWLPLFLAFLAGPAWAQAQLSTIISPTTFVISPAAGVSSFTVSTPSVVGVTPIGTFPVFVGGTINTQQVSQANGTAFVVSPSTSPWSVNGNVSIGTSPFTVVCAAGCASAGASPSTVVISAGNITNTVTTSLNNSVTIAGTPTTSLTGAVSIYGNVTASGSPTTVVCAAGCASAGASPTTVVISAGNVTATGSPATVVVAAQATLTTSPVAGVYVISPATGTSAFIVSMSTGVSLTNSTIPVSIPGTQLVSLNAATVPVSMSGPVSLVAASAISIGTTGVVSLNGTALTSVPLLVPTGEQNGSAWPDRANFFAGSTTVGSAATATLVNAPGSGRLYVTGLGCARSDSATSAMTVAFNISASAGGKFTIVVPPPSQAAAFLTLATPLSVAATQPLQFTPSSSPSVLGLTCNANGYTAP